MSVFLSAWFHVALGDGRGALHFQQTRKVEEEATWGFGEQGPLPGRGGFRRVSLRDFGLLSEGENSFILVTFGNVDRAFLLPPLQSAWGCVCWRLGDWGAAEHPAHSPHSAALSSPGAGTPALLLMG